MTEPDPQTDATPAPPAAPVLRILTPSATAEEVAAVVAVLASLGGGGEPPARRTPEWSRPVRGHRAPVAHGPGGWRASALPR